MNYIIEDGNITLREKLSINHEDRAYQFGDGVYEVIGVYEGKPFKIKEHLTRLQYSCNEIDISFTESISDLEDKLLELKEKNKLQNGHIYLQVSRGISNRNHSFPPKEVLPKFIAYTLEVPRPTSEMYQKGVKALITEDIRWLRCDIKSLNLLPNVLAKEKAVKTGSYEAILQRDGIVTEGSSTNLFVVSNEIVFTHPATNKILNGITRRTILEICQDKNISVKQEEFDVNFLLNADEVFITGTYIDILPLREINKQKYEVGPIYNLLKKEIDFLTM
ncbi:D-amino-acid transaminase [Planococcus beigongshangi]|uniref:D-amino-acid transaminase n=1 Tax=Planococcus beigongshangi TaxID=2782536 RepID=UPI00193B4288